MFKEGNVGILVGLAADTSSIVDNIFTNFSGDVISLAYGAERMEIRQNTFCR